MHGCGSAGLRTAKDWHVHAGRDGNMGSTPLSAWREPCRGNVAVPAGGLIRQCDIILLRNIHSN
jgi:hypothetical protein